MVWRGEQYAARDRPVLPEIREVPDQGRRSDQADQRRAFPSPGLHRSHEQGRRLLALHLRGPERAIDRKPSPDQLAAEHAFHAGARRRVVPRRGIAASSAAGHGAWHSPGATPGMNRAPGAGQPGQQTNPATAANPLESQPQPLDGTVMGGNIIGVGSKIKKPSVRVYLGGDTYQEWEFIWNPTGRMQFPGRHLLNPNANPTAAPNGTAPNGANPNNLRTAASRNRTSKSADQSTPVPQAPSRWAQRLVRVCPVRIARQWQNHTASLHEQSRSYRAASADSVKCCTINASSAACA